MSNTETFWIKRIGASSTGSQMWVCRKQPENHIGDKFVETIHVIEKQAYDKAVEALKTLYTEAVFMDVETGTRFLGQTLKELGEI